MTNTGTMQAMKTNAVSTNCNRPYLYEMHNYEMFYMNPMSPVKPTIVYIFNSLAKTLDLNIYAKMPKYIIVIPDKDIVESLQLYDFGTRALIDRNIQWLIKKLAQALLNRREQLQKQ